MTKQNAPRMPSPRTSVMAVRVAPEQRQRIEAAAIERGLSISGYISTTLADALSGRRTTPRVETVATTPPPAPQPDAAFFNELHRIGNNVNQIARAINSGLPPETVQSARTIDQLLRLLREQPEQFLRIVEATNQTTPPAQIPTAPIAPAPPRSLPPLTPWPQPQSPPQAPAQPRQAPPPRFHAPAPPNPPPARPVPPPPTQATTRPAPPPRPYTPAAPQPPRPPTDDPQNPQPRSFLPNFNQLRFARPKGEK